MRKNGLLSAIAILVYLFLLGPILVVVATSFSPNAGLEFPPSGLSLQWYAKALTYGPFRDAAITSVIVALVGTLLALAVGVPAALALQRYEFKGKAAIQSFFLSPVIVPEIVVGLALLQQVMVALQLTALWALILGHTVVLIPYAVRVTGASLATYDARVEERRPGAWAPAPSPPSSG